MEHGFGPTGNPALIAQLEHMRREVRRLTSNSALERATGPEAHDSVADDVNATARSLLSQCQGASHCARLGLDLLVNHTRGNHGFLFALDGAVLRLIAPQHGAEPATQLPADARSLFEAGDAGKTEVRTR